MKTALASISLLFLAIGCASSQKKADAGPEASRVAVAECGQHFGEIDSTGPITEYRTARDVASSPARLNELEGKQPPPADADAFLEHTSLLDAEGKGAEAQKRLRTFLAQNPEDKRAVFLLAVHYWRNHKRELGTFLFGQLEKDANFPWKSLLLNNLGMIALNDKNRELALSYFEKATKEQPTTPAPFVNLGAMYLQSRSYASAQPLFEKARSLDPDFEDATLGFAVALEGQGKFDEAHNAYAEFTGGHPNALAMVYNDSLILGNRLARKEEAAQQMLRYIQRGGKETARAQEIIQSWR